MTNFLARCWLRLWRWHTVTGDGAVPARCVVIAAPHTTNWDFPITLAMARVSGIRISWLGKDSLFRGPMGPVMRRLGGVSVDRSAAGGMVAALALPRPLLVINGSEITKLVAQLGHMNAVFITDANAMLPKAGLNPVDAAREQLKTANAQGGSVDDFLGDSATAGDPLIALVGTS